MGNRIGPLVLTVSLILSIGFFLYVLGLRHQLDEMGPEFTRAQEACKRAASYYQDQSVVIKDGEVVDHVTMLERAIADIERQNEEFRKQHDGNPIKPRWGYMPSSVSVGF